MSRTARECPGGYIYHIWNRAAGNQRFFKKEEDFLAFQQVLIEAQQRHPIPLLDWCLMPNHWHFVVHPRNDRQVSEFFRWLTHTHAMRASSQRRMIGMGPLYRGRFKSMPVQKDEHLLELLRYVQRNPVRAGEVKLAEKWQWTGEWARSNGEKELSSILSPCPVKRPRNWLSWVNQAQTPEATEAIRTCVRRSGPYGDADWTKRTAEKLNLQSSQRPPGRPRKLKTAKRGHS